MSCRISQLAERLGATEEPPGICWRWYVGFPTKKAGDEFVDALKAGGADYRGPYDCEDGISVRVRIGETI